MPAQMSGHKPYSQGRLLDLSRETGRAPYTLRRWAREGCDLDNPEELREYARKMDSRKPQWAKERGYSRIGRQPAPIQSAKQTESVPKTAVSNGEPLPEGRRGAAAALERLEREEEQAHRRLHAALAGGNPMAIDSAESFWLKCSETLRRLDLAVETARREAETQVPLRVAQDAVTASSEWIRIAFMQFLSSEARALMGIHEVGEWKAYAIERFKGVLHFTIKNAEKTNSMIPDWAVTRIKDAWNVSKADSGAVDEMGVP